MKTDSAGALCPRQFKFTPEQRRQTPALKAFLAKQSGRDEKGKCPK